MAKLTDLTVNIGLKVDENTAEACLKMVELYMNQTGLKVLSETDTFGEVTLKYLDAKGVSKHLMDRATERNLLLVERDSLKQQFDVLLQTIEQLEDEIQRLERELNG